MFNKVEKQALATAIEKLLLDLNHPELPKEKIFFSLHINGIDEWSFANITPNWKYKEQGSFTKPIRNEIVKGQV